MSMDQVFRRALKRYEKAVRAHEFLGSQPPEDRPSIEEEFQAARLALIRMVEGG